MNLLKTCISNQVNIDPTALDRIVSNFDTVELAKGHFFHRSGKICRKMAFIESGFLRMYDVADGKEVTFWIGSSGKFITALSSFVFETPSYWNIQAITDAKLYVISREKHFELSGTEPKWLEFDNKLLAHSFALLEEKMFAQLHTTAKERFQKLMKEEPELFRHVPLHYIASMLGITPESLSRLRKNLTDSVS